MTPYNSTVDYTNINPFRDYHMLLRMIDDGQAVDISGLSEKTLVVGSVIRSKLETQCPVVDNPELHNDLSAEQPNGEHMPANDGSKLPCAQEDVPAPRKRVMPSAELLAAAAKLTEADAALREAEIGDDDVLFIGPPPPAVVNEAASPNDAEHFEEVTRIMGAQVDDPYDIVGVDRNMAADSIKKRLEETFNAESAATLLW